MFKRIVAASVAVLLTSNGIAFAGITSGTAFTVQVTVVAGCNINTGSPVGTIDFGTVAGTASAPADQSGNIVVTCTNTTPYKVYFTSANTVTGGTNRIMTGATGTDTVGYQILQGATPISNNNASGFVAGTGNGSSQTTALSFHINAWTPVTPTVYTDTVTMQVEF